MKRPAFLLVICSCLVSLVGCAQRQDLLDNDWTKDNRTGQARWREVESLFTPAKVEPKNQTATLRGVRHGLTMSRLAEPTARCTCLDVVAGPATDARLSWGGDVPTLSPEQIAVAMRTEGSKCGAPEGQVRRPSIYAVDEVNGNTVIVVEELPADRPQALGAIVPMPQNGGAIYVRARSDKGHEAMYGLGAQGPASMCHVMTRGAPSTSAAP